MHDSQPRSRIASAAALAAALLAGSLVWAAPPPTGKGALDQAAWAAEMGNHRLAAQLYLDLYQQRPSANLAALAARQFEADGGLAKACNLWRIAMADARWRRKMRNGDVKQRALEATVHDHLATCAGVAPATTPVPVWRGVTGRATRRAATGRRCQPHQALRVGSVAGADTEVTPHIAGTVVDAGGWPVTGATFNVSAPPHPFFARHTGDTLDSVSKDGDFSIYPVYRQLPFWLLVQGPRGREAAAFQVTRSTQCDMQIRLKPAYSVIGSAKQYAAVSGRSVHGNAEWQQWTPGGWRTFARQRFDKAGRFRISLPPGRYRLRSRGACFTNPGWLLDLPPLLTVAERAEFLHSAAAPALAGRTLPSRRLTCGAGRCYRLDLGELPQLEPQCMPTSLPSSWRAAIDATLQSTRPIGQAQQSRRDRWLLILFWAGGCPLSKDRLRQLARIRANPAMKHLDVVAVAEPGVRNQTEARAILDNMMQGHPERAAVVTLPVLLDADGRMLKESGLGGQLFVAVRPKGGLLHGGSLPELADISARVWANR